jgi:hypothetical protein
VSQIICAFLSKKKSTVPFLAELRALQLASDCDVFLSSPLIDRQVRFYLLIFFKVTAGGGSPPEYILIALCYNIQKLHSPHFFSLWVSLL